MRLVVADAGPLNYLVLVDAIALLPQMFDQVFIPAEVRNELDANDAPASVRAWITSAPPWLHIRQVTKDELDTLAAKSLDIGERAALALARSLPADLILMDDRAAVAVARREGFVVTGTLGVLTWPRAADSLIYPQLSRVSKPPISVTGQKSWTCSLSNIARLPNERSRLSNCY